MAEGSQNLDGRYHIGINVDTQYSPDWSRHWSRCQYCTKRINGRAR